MSKTMMKMRMIISTMKTNNIVVKPDLEATLAIDLVVTPFALNLFLFRHLVSCTLLKSLTNDGWLGALFLILFPL